MRLGSGVPLSVYGFAALRVIEKDGNPWFVASEVCGVLGIANATDAVRTVYAALMMTSMP